MKTVSTEISETHYQVLTCLERVSTTELWHETWVAGLTFQRPDRECRDAEQPSVEVCSHWNT